MKQEIKKYLNQWKTKATEDLLVIEELTKDKIIATSAICFHCQQFVEKYLKMFLIYNNKEIQKTHNIEYLLVECAEIDEEFNNIDPKNLSEFGVSARYPGDFYMPTEKEALEYKELILEIKKIVEKKVKI